MDDTTEKNPPGMGIFLGFMAIVSVSLVLLLPVATKPGPETQGWWTQPIFMPSVSLTIFAVTAVYLFANHLWVIRKNEGMSHGREGVIAELIEWAKPLEFFVYYMIYIYVLGLLGYFLSSVLFAIGLSLRVRLTGRRWMIAALLFVLALTAMFRWGLKVWFPEPVLFSMFPPGLRLFFTRYF